MSEAPPSDPAGHAVGNGQEVLTPAAIESVLADFRSWLQHLSSASPSEQEAGESAQPLDLHTLLGQSIALRQEVNLQTKAARSQQEQTGLALQQLGQALEALRQAQAAAQQANQQAEEEILRPLLKTLLDVHDAFCLAEREIRRAPETIFPILDELVLKPSSAEMAAFDGEPESFLAHRVFLLNSTWTATRALHRSRRSHRKNHYGRGYSLAAVIRTMPRGRRGRQRYWPGSKPGSRCSVPGLKSNDKRWLLNTNATRG